MKKRVSLALAGLLAGLLVGSVLPGAASASRLYPMGNNDHVNVYVNGTLLTLDQPALVKNDRTLVPFRAVLEALGAQVSWKEDTQTVFATKGDIKIELPLHSTTAKKNGQDVNLDVPAEQINYRTMVPLRFMAEALGAKIGWAGKTSSAFVSTYEDDSMVSLAGYILDMTEMFNELLRVGKDSDTIYSNYVHHTITYSEFTSTYWKNRDELQAVYNKMIAIPVPDNSFAQHYSERTKAFMSHMFDMLDIRGSIFHEDGSPDVEKAKGLITLMDEFTADGEAYSQEFTSTAN